MEIGLVEQKTNYYHGGNSATAKPERKKMENLEQTGEVKGRSLNEAPESFTKKSVEEFLRNRGACGIITAHGIATILNVGYRVIKDAERNGEFKSIDKCTYRLEDLIDWIMKNPRFIAQSHAKWDVTENTPEIAKTVIKKSWTALLKFWELEDLIAEVCYRMLQQKKTSECSEELVITRILAKIWREMKSRTIHKTVSLDAINEKYGEKEHDRF